MAKSKSEVTMYYDILSEEQCQAMVEQVLVHAFNIANENSCAFTTEYLNRAGTLANVLVKVKSFATGLFQTFPVVLDLQGNFESYLVNRVLSHIEVVRPGIILKHSYSPGSLPI